MIALMELTTVNRNVIKQVTEEMLETDEYLYYFPFSTTSRVKVHVNFSVTFILYCGIFAQSKNRGATDTAVASEWLSNNICLYATTAKQTEQRPLLGGRFLMSNN